MTDTDTIRMEEAALMLAIKNTRELLLLGIADDQETYTLCARLVKLRKEQLALWKQHGKTFEEKEVVYF